MVEKFGKQGFAVLGITNEGKAETQGYMDKTKAMMAVALVPKSDNSMAAFGFRGYPSAALIAPDGTVAWKGHPSSLTEAIIEPLLSKVKKRAAATVSIDVELPKRHAAIAKRFEKGEFGAALTDLKKALEKATDEDRQALSDASTAVEETLSGLQKDVETLRGEGRFADAEASLELIVKHFKGHESEKAARTALTEMKADPALKDELEAGRRIRKAQTEAAAGKKTAALATLKSVTEGRLAATKEAARAATVAAEISAGS